MRKLRLFLLLSGVAAVMASGCSNSTSHQQAPMAGVESGDGSATTQPPGAGTAAPNASDSFVWRQADVGLLATPALFVLGVEKSDVLPLGERELLTQNAFVSLTNEYEYLGGRVNALQIQFLSQAITDETMSRLLSGQHAEVAGGAGVATILLFLGKENEINQVNLTFQMPGTTVTRTVAHTAEDIARMFPTYHYDRQRLRLVSRTRFAEAESQRLTLSWNVDFEVPVVDVRKSHSASVAGATTAGR